MIVSFWQLAPKYFRKHRIESCKFWFPGHGEVSGIEITLSDQLREKVFFGPKKIMISSCFFQWLVVVIGDAENRPIYSRIEKFSLLSFYPSPEEIMISVASSAASGEESKIESDELFRFRRAYPSRVTTLSELKHAVFTRMNFGAERQDQEKTENVPA